MLTSTDFMDITSKVIATFGQHAVPWTGMPDDQKRAVMDEWADRLKPHERGDIIAAINHHARINPDRAPSLGALLIEVQRCARQRIAHDPTEARRAVCDGTRWIPHDPDEDGISRTNTYTPCPACNPYNAELHATGDLRYGKGADHKRQYESMNPPRKACGT